MGDASQTESYFLPFYGQTDNVTITEDGAALSLEIERAVARMDVYLRAEEKAVLDCHVTPASTLKVERSSAKGYFAPATPTRRGRRPHVHVRYDNTIGQSDKYG